jgi:hypothetical protein
MKAGFLFTNRATARRVLGQTDRHDTTTRPERGFFATLAVVITKLFGR